MLHNFWQCWIHQGVVFSSEPVVPKDVPRVRPSWGTGRSFHHTRSGMKSHCGFVPLGPVPWCRSTAHRIRFLDRGGMLFELRRRLVLHPLDVLLPCNLPFVHIIKVSPNLVELRHSRDMTSKKTINLNEFFLVYCVRAIQVEKSKHEICTACRTGVPQTAQERLEFVE